MEYGSWGSPISRRRFLVGTAGVGIAAGTASVLGLPVWSTPSSAAQGVTGAAGDGVATPSVIDASLGLGSAVFGGSLQYFRMSASAVQARIAVCRKAAFTVLQTYVPWNVHEFVPGVFDFTGQSHPILPDDHLDEYQEQDPIQELQTGGLNGRAGLFCNTDLHGYLSLCHDAGLKVILRPGPFISDEWRNGGLPDWFLDLAPPDMYEYGPDGTPLLAAAPFGNYPLAGITGGQTLYYFPQPSYASTHYLAGCARWLGAFAEFVKPWLATNGGPVVAVQVDDEACYFYRFGPFEVDYNPAMLDRYHAATGAEAPRAWPPTAKGVASLRPAFSWQRFKGHQVGAYLAALAADLRRGGVDVPITHEIEQNMVGPTDIADLATAVLVNPETYPGGTGPEVMPTISLTVQAVRAAQRNKVNVWCAEMESAITLFDLLIGEGIIGGIPFNYTDGVSDGEVVARGRLGRTLRTAGTLLTGSKRRADVAVIWDASLVGAPYHSERWGFRTDVRRVIENHVPMLVTLLLRSGLSFDFLDVEAAHSSDYDPAEYPTIFLASADILTRAAQDALVAYVKAGGRLICWPSPPSLDEDLLACTILADACFPEAEDTFYPDDAQSISLLNHPVTVWRGVQTYHLSSHATAIATRSGSPCGYSRPLGAGLAVLLGAWLAADSPTGREFSILQQEPVPSGLGQLLDEVVALRAMAVTWFGPAAAELIPDLLPGGPAKSLIAYIYPNQRRYGEFVSGGVLAYSNGDQAIGLVEINTTDTGLGITPFPYHPIEAAHVAAAQGLSQVTPGVRVSDLRVQARILDAPIPGAATVMAANRWPDPLEVVLSTTVDGHRFTLPSTGALTLPGDTGLLMPIGYPLGGGAMVVQATAQVTGFSQMASQVTVELWSPSGGEAIFSLPSGLTGATIDGRSLTVGLGSRVVTVSMPAGDHTLVLRWA
ncbi:MAG: beta-galactosidase [Acidimicrobiales bacterium]